MLAGLLVLVPDLEERLREAQPGRGRQKTAATILGSTNGFFLGQALTDKAKQVVLTSAVPLQGYGGNAKCHGRG